MDVLRFRYRKDSGEESERALMNWKETGVYVTGLCSDSHQVKTFRKDRVLQWHDGAATRLTDPHPAPPSLKRAKDERWQVWFTCFSEAEKAEIQQLATAGGLKVVGSATLDLNILCIGPSGRNPFSKIEQARARGAYIVSAQELLHFIEVGELPADALS